MQYLVFDIETCGHDFDALEESQQEYLTRNAKDEAEREQKINEMSLNPLTAQIVTLGMAFVSSPNADPKGAAYSNSTVIGEMQVLPDGTQWQEMPERDLLEKWWKILADKPDITLLSFNGRNFDAPFIMLRSAILGVQPTRNLMSGTKFNYNQHIDLIDELSFYGFDKVGATRRFNFDFYCKAFGVETPKSSDMHGGLVPEKFREGKHKEIAEYCMRDVYATWKLFKRVDPYLMIRK